MALTRPLRLTVSFSVILIVLLFLVQWFIDTGVRNSNEGYFNKINLLVNKHTDARVVFFGSSVGEVAFDIPLIEKQTGLTAYNFCIDGTRFAQYEGLIREFNQFSDSCEIVVMAETFFSLSKIDKLTEPDRYLGYLNNENVYRSLFNIQPDLVWKARYVPFYKYVLMSDRYLKASANGWSNIIAEAKPDTLKGFTPKHKSWEPHLDELNRKTEPLLIQIDSATVMRYKTIISELKAKKRKVVIVIPPIQKDGLNLLPNIDVLRRTLSSMETKNVSFLDFSDAKLSVDKKYFYNNSHLNDIGAEIFSKKISITIDSIFNQTN